MTVLVILLAYLAAATRIGRLLRRRQPPAAAPVPVLDPEQLEHQQLVTHQVEDAANTWLHDNPVLPEAWLLLTTDTSERGADS